METQEKLRLVSKYNRNQYKSAIISQFKEKNRANKSALPNIHDKINKYNDDNMVDERLIDKNQNLS